MTMPRSYVLMLPMLLIFGAVVHAETSSPVVNQQTLDNGTTTIDAQRLEMYLDREMRAFGDAEVSRDGKVVKGDRIDYNVVSHEIHATGNVHLLQGDTKVDGPELRLKMDEREGEMTQPVFALGGENEKKARGSAETILFEGQTKERFKNARLTTCEVGRDDWFLRANELEIDHHTETATAHHASIEFKGVPIMYTPWIDFPFSNQRKSGLMVPTFGTTSKSGFELMVPYYWNIAPNQDATLGVRSLSKRGTQFQGEYRYLGESFNGKDYAEYLPGDDMTDKNRFYFNITHNQSFGNGWSGNVQIERVSDDQYFSDLSTHVIVTSRVNLAQQIGLNYDHQDWHFSALAQQFQTLDKASYPYQRLPQLALSGAEELGPVDATLWSEFVRFEKNDKATATVTANRFTLYPSVSLPLTQSYGYITPKVGVHYTQYDLGGNTAFTNNGVADHYQSDTRVLPILSVDSGLYFDREMRVVKNVYTQTLEPRLFYVYIPHEDQSRTPIFDTGLSDLNLATIFLENQFSGGDRVNDASQATLALTSRMIDKNTGIQRLSATIAERFYFADQRVTMPGSTPRKGSHSDLITAATANLLNGWNIDAAWQFNTDTSATVKANLSARYQPGQGKVLNLSYRFSDDTLGQTGLEQVDASSEWPLGGNWYGLGRLSYFLRDNPATNDKRGPAEYLAGLEYNAGCWQGRTVLHRLSTATANANYAIFFQLEFSGLSKIGSSPTDVLQRTIPGYTNTRLIPENTFR